VTTTFGLVEVGEVIHPVTTEAYAGNMAIKNVPQPPIPTANTTPKAPPSLPPAQAASVASGSQLLGSRR
jgi:hypothetical protein